VPTPLRAAGARAFDERGREFGIGHVELHGAHAGSVRALAVAALAKAGPSNAVGRKVLIRAGAGRSHR
jgi:hypothetical protein